MKVVCARYLLACLVSVREAEACRVTDRVTGGKFGLDAVCSDAGTVVCLCFVDP